MARVIAVVFVMLFLAACTSPRSLQTTEHPPVWDYSNDPFACKALVGTC